MNPIDNVHSIECTIHGFQRRAQQKRISFNVGVDLQTHVHGALGPGGISATAADLLDFGTAIYQIERLLGGRGRLNRPDQIELTMQLRNREAWSTKAVQTAEEILRVLGNATWKLSFTPGLTVAVPSHEVAPNDAAVRQVALLSGGMDSTCGAITLSRDPAQTRFVSFYGTHQKELQNSIAAELGFRAPTQFRLQWAGSSRPGGSFYYRTFLFLSIAAVVASSWGVCRILQFENGVLATSIPPTPAYWMTKHAHPELHRLTSSLFSELFAGEWQIINPFMLLTKRGCVQEASRVLGDGTARRLLGKTETCWFHWSNRIERGGKTPGKPCGVCVPCVIRRTAISEGDYCYDLVTNETLRALDPHGVAFQSYYDFVRRILNCRHEYDFFDILSGGFDLTTYDSPISLEQLYRLFHTFGEEFVDTYGIHMDQ